MLPSRVKQYLAVHLLLAISLSAAPALAQSAPQPPAPVTRMAVDAHPSFAVAVIKPHDPASYRQGFNVEGDRTMIHNKTVSTLVSIAYSIDVRQIAGGPDWFSRDGFDIEGTTDSPGEPSAPQQQEMLQKLLADRFGLRFHREKRDIPVYAIVVAKGGPKLKPAADPDAQPGQKSSRNGTELTVTCISASITDFIMGENFLLDRPLIDQTGLTGRYDFTIHYTPDEAHAADPNAPPGIFTAVQEQLGLKFQPTKAQAEVLVIDHIERPSEN